jgi:hypothetical protein
MNNILPMMDELVQPKENEKTAQNGLSHDSIVRHCVHAPE